MAKHTLSSRRKLTVGDSFGDSRQPHLNIVCEACTILLDQRLQNYIGKCHNVSASQEVISTQRRVYRTAYGFQCSFIRHNIVRHQKPSINASRYANMTRIGRIYTHKTTEQLPDNNTTVYNNVSYHSRRCRRTWTRSILATNSELP